MYSVRLALLASLVVATAGTYTLEDLKHVVTTDEKIWIRCTNHHIKRDCIHMKIQRFFRNYHLLQHYKVQRARERRLYIARLSNGERGHHGPIMYLTGTEGIRPPTTAYTLIFWDPLEHCAVFEQTDSGRRATSGYLDR
nr:uncharacterized protein LOC129385762 isoform X2 [Dermacentor andersoni]